MSFQFSVFPFRGGLGGGKVWAFLLSSKPENPHLAFFSVGKEALSSARRKGGHVGCVWVCRVGLSSVPPMCLSEHHRLYCSPKVPVKWDPPKPSPQKGTWSLASAPLRTDKAEGCSFFEGRVRLARPLWWGDLGGLLR